MKMNGRIKPFRRSAYGANLTEFPAALAILVLGFMIPMLDLGIIPVHWLLSKEIVSGYVRKLALCETFSQAQTMVNSDPSLQNWITQLGGIKPETITCHLIISRLTPPLDNIVIDQVGSIPKEWLPGGKMSPCSYEMELVVQAQFNPLITIKMGKTDIPGLSKPFTGLVTAKAPWENYGLNPVSKGFFINE